LKSRIAFAALMAVLVSGTAFHFSQHWFPASANAYSRLFDSAWNANLLLLGIAFVVTHLALAVLTFSRRDTAVKERQPSFRVEALWAAVAAILFVGLAAASTRDWERDKPIGKSKTPLRIEVVGQQFRWYFRYPGTDQTFGRTDLRLVDASEGNPLGLDKSDPAANDDRVIAELVVPTGQEVEVDLRSMDVIHSFFVPELRFKQDAVPGMLIPAHFQFDKPGQYEIACAELCGLGHHQMNAKLRVLSGEEFTAWEQRK
jgi:cytochrome c oxidase subunit 2